MSSIHCETQRHALPRAAYKSCAAPDYFSADSPIAGLSRSYLLERLFMVPDALAMSETQRGRCTW